MEQRGTRAASGDGTGSHPPVTGSPGGSVGSIGSRSSVGSIASAGSIGSIGSIGSVASIGSIGSIASIGSIGSIASIGARGAVGSGGDPRACARDRARVGFPGRPRARRGGLFATFLTLAVQLFVALLAAHALRP